MCVCKKQTDVRTSPDKDDSNNVEPDVDVLGKNAIKFVTRLPVVLELVQLEKYLNDLTDESLEDGSRQVAVQNHIEFIEVVAFQEFSQRLPQHSDGRPHYGREEYFVLDAICSARGIAIYTQV